MLAADGAVSMFPGGVEEASEAEGMPARECGWSSENVHANWTCDLLNLPLHNTL